MHDPPSLQQMADLVDRPRHALVQRPCPAAAAEHQEWMRITLDSGRIASADGIPGPDRIAGQSHRAATTMPILRFLKDSANQRGAAGQPARGLSGNGVLLEQHQRQPAAGRRPGPWARWRSRPSPTTAATRCFAQKPPGGQIARQVLDHERDRLARRGAARDGRAGQSIRTRRGSPTRARTACRRRRT